MEEIEAQSELTSDKHDSMQTAEAKAHHYDASKYDKHFHAMFFTVI
jgi:hypothetical protein